MRRTWSALAAAMAAALLLRAAAEDGLLSRLRDAADSGALAAAVLKLELGVSLPVATPPSEAEPESAAETAPEPEESRPPEADAAPAADEPSGVTAPDNAEAVPSAESAAPEDDTGEASKPAPEAEPVPETESVPESPSVPELTPVPESAPAAEGLPEAQPLPAREEWRPAVEPLTAVFSSERVINRTSQEVDVDALLAEDMDVHLSGSGAQVLILHTHGTEAFTQDAEHRYEESDEYRTTDTAYNVVYLGDILSEELSAQGLRVIHDRTLYDYPSYTGSYSRSAAAVESVLERYPEVAVVIDLHRDALGSGDVIYKTRAEVSDEVSAQVMLLVGTGENGLEHPDWRENFKLALHLKEAMDQRYPTLARSVELVKERYNQHYTHGSLILEVGSSGNTLPEAVCAVRLFARSAGPVLLSLVD